MVDEKLALAYLYDLIFLFSHSLCSSHTDPFFKHTAYLLGSLSSARNILSPDLPSYSDLISNVNLLR